MAALFSPSLISLVVIIVLSLSIGVGAQVERCVLPSGTDTYLCDGLKNTESDTDESNTFPILFNIVVNEISDVNDAAQTFTADFYVSMFYQDPVVTEWITSQVGNTSADWEQEITSNYSPLSLELKSSAEQVSATYSTKKAHRYSGRFSDNNFPPKKGTWGVINGNRTLDWVEYDEHYRGTFRSPLYLQDFPFDDQFLVLSFELSQNDIVKRYFQGRTDGTESFIEASVLAPVGFQLSPESVVVSNNTYLNFNQTFSRISFRMRTARLAGAVYGVRIISTLVITTSMTFLLYAFPIDSSDRHMNSATFFLAAVSYLFVITSDLPKIPYTTRLDNFILVSLLNNLLCYSWFTAVFYFDSDHIYPLVLEEARIRMRRREWMSCATIIVWYAVWSALSLALNLPYALVISAYLGALFVSCGVVMLKAKINAAVYEVPVQVEFSPQKTDEIDFFNKMDSIIRPEYFVINKGGGMNALRNKFFQEKHNEIKAIVTYLRDSEKDNDLTVEIKASDKRDRIRRRISQALAETVEDVKENHRDWQVDSDDEDESEEHQIERRKTLKTMFDIRAIVWREWMKPALTLDEPHLTAKQVGIHVPWLFQYARCDSTKSKLHATVNLESYLVKLYKESKGFLARTNNSLVGTKQQQQQNGSSAPYGMASLTDPLVDYVPLGSQQNLLQQQPHHNHQKVGGGTGDDSETGSNISRNSSRKSLKSETARKLSNKDLLLQQNQPTEVSNRYALCRTGTRTRPRKPDSLSSHPSAGQQQQHNRPVSFAAGGAQQFSYWYDPDADEEEEEEEDHANEEVPDVQTQAEGDSSSNGLLTIVPPAAAMASSSSRREELAMSMVRFNLMDTTLGPVKTRKQRLLDVLELLGTIFEQLDPSSFEKKLAEAEREAAQQPVKKIQTEKTTEAQEPGQDTSHKQEQQQQGLQHGAADTSDPSSDTRAESTPLSHRSAASRSGEESHQTSTETGNFNSSESNHTLPEEDGGSGGSGARSNGDPLAKFRSRGKTSLASMKRRKSLSPQGPLEPQQSLQ